MRRNTGKSKKILQKIIVSFVAIATIFVFDYWIFSPQQFPSPSQVVSEENYIDSSSLPEEVGKQEATPSPKATAGEEEDKDEGIIENSSDTLKQITKDINLDVPFTVQAPYGVWDDLHNEACEEAVLIMAKHWLDNTGIDNKTADQEILDSVEWQEENFGGHYDLRVLDIIDLARRYFNIEKIYYSRVTSIDDITYQLSKGNLVITPMAGRLLDNPYYKFPGPPYHAVVAKGYDETNIITHDPGTKRGADFKYTYDNFFDSIHDWPYSLGEKAGLSKDQRAEEALKGERIMIVVEKADD